MAIDYDKILQVYARGPRLKYDDRDVILYALGIGFGRDPLNEAELSFVCENGGLKVVPTMATVFGQASEIVEPAGLDYTKVVHAEERLTVHKPLPTSAELIVEQRVVGAYDKGAAKGAIVAVERTITDATSNDKLSTVLFTMFARGDGGFGGPRDGAPEPHRLPERSPDLAVACDTRPDQALLYALSGDRNPLHRDPYTAKLAGFDRPILHGRCTYGTACRAILGAFCNYEPERIVGFDARFTAPVFPGETIVVEAWDDGQIVSFRAKVKERDVVVLDNGKCTLSD